ncbi:hypothetical protein BDZ89DRAFT_1055860 [Hymenopellis radicata]|nr:hypothetical protein BDZ89DRAFT_1055860 [Hymenopellis radicata]
MGERKKSGSSKASVKSTKQKTLFDHFVKKPALETPSDTETGPAEADTAFIADAEIIDIETLSPEPEPFFSHNNNLPPSSPNDSEDDIQVTSIVENPIVRPGGSRGDPIVIIESPTPASSLSATCDSLTPYPTRDTQHTRGPQGVYQPSASHQTVLSRAAYKEPSPAVSLPEVHRDHPAIERLVHAPNNGDPQKLWTDKWRPTRADQVLGNEENALFLRNWLRELQVELVPHSEPPPATRVLSSKGKGKATLSENPKKRRITREVSKRSRKKQRIESDEEDWIVPDGDVSEEEEPEHPVRIKDNDDYAPPMPRPASPYRSAFSVDKLSNTIVLSGPSGSGKTAAVYACADEMGWEVFEVYPGIGKRNSTNLDNLVGQVGKNHLVSKAHVREEDPSRSQFPTLFQGREKHGLSRKDDDTPVNSTVNQSLILLEEVDILFKEDANFWPAVIALIKDCKRPVICTCNDLSLLPLDDLPVQKTLLFKPCEPELAVSYLQSLCAAEGFTVLAKSPTRVDLESTPDLRSAINTLQLWCPGRSDWTGDLQPWEHVEDWERCSNNSLNPKGVLSVFHADLLSYSDCHLARLPVDTAEAIASSQVSASSDDEVGHGILFSPRDDLTRRDFYGHRDRDRLIASIVSRGADTFGRTFSSPRYVAARVVEQLGIEVVGAYNWRKEAFWVDYLPWMRQILEADDEEERKTASMEVLGGRRTRNRQSQRYVRTLSVTEEQRQALEKRLLGRNVTILREVSSRVE